MRNKAGALARLCDLADVALTSFSYLFNLPSPAGGFTLRNNDSAPLALLHGLLNAIRHDIGVGEAVRGRRMFRRGDADAPDPIDFLNLLAEKTNGSPLYGIIAAETLEALPHYFSDGDKELGEGEARELRQFLAHSFRLSTATTALLAAYFQLLERDGSSIETASDELPRLNHRTAQLAAPPPAYPSAAGIPEIIAHLREVAIRIDQFAFSRTFRFIEREFVPVRLAHISPPEKFFGYQEVRAVFKEFFETFSAGRQNLPLLISSLPGLGKTHFAVSHTLAHNELTLILPEPQDLERPLETLIRRLSTFKNRKFVLFFDDVDTRLVNWYYFRTNVGGSFSLPPHIAIVISSNFEFPANISSRGRGVTFPLFDEVMCQEMVHDFLIALGMKNPKNELISSIAADYTEAFGQRIFEELSPRTLVRYFEQYETDSEKRRKMLDISHGQVIAKPDSQLFQETNQRIIERLKNSP